jgi:hypothetical protein
VYYKLTLSPEDLYGMLHQKLNKTCQGYFHSWLVPSGSISKFEG